MNAPRVGGDVDAFCTRCRLLLGHTVLAMVGSRIARVRCNTCQGEHAYKPAPGAASSGPARERRSASPAARPVRERREVRPFEDLFAGKDPASATPYSPRSRFAEGELLHHPSFGLGVVQGARGDKVDVAFRAGVKTLVHGLGEAGKAPVEFDKGRRASPQE